MIRDRLGDPVPPDLGRNWWSMGSVDIRPEGMILVQGFAWAVLSSMSMYVGKTREKKGTFKTQVQGGCEEGRASQPQPRASTSLQTARYIV